jgi:hypothetical protein
MQIQENMRQADAQLLSALRDSGYAFVAGAGMRTQLEAFASLDDWPAFSESWNDLPLDTYMADHGRYRRRRHAVYSIAGGELPIRLPAQPHYQALDYNPVNGGIERWFEPVRADLGEGPSMRAVLGLCATLFGAVAGTPKQAWKVEVHQFRIEAQGDAPGLPTPEGMHRDGVDFVLVLLVRRSNVRSGTTLIGSPDGTFRSSFTLAAPFDAALVDDHRVYHGVTPVETIDRAQPAWRDVLVVTLRHA